VHADELVSRTGLGGGDGPGAAQTTMQGAPMSWSSRPRGDRSPARLEQVLQVHGDFVAACRREVQGAFGGVKHRALDGSAAGHSPSGSLSVTASR